MKHFIFSLSRVILNFGMHASLANAAQLYDVPKVIYTPPPTPPPVIAPSAQAPAVPPFNPSAFMNGGRGAASAPVQTQTPASAVLSPADTASDFVPTSNSSTAWGASPMSNCKTSQIDSAMVSKFKSCKRSSSSGSDKSALLVDADKKMAFLTRGDGTVLNCFPIIVGAASQGDPAALGTGKNETQGGLFTTEAHGDANSIYQTCSYGVAKACQMECTKDQPRSECTSDSIGMSGAVGGRVIHAWHGHNTTAGCIGIKDDRLEELKTALGTNGASVFVWGRNLNGCGVDGKGNAGGADALKPGAAEGAN